MPCGVGLFFVLKILFLEILGNFFLWQALPENLLLTLVVLDFLLVDYSSGIR